MRRGFLLAFLALGAGGGVAFSDPADLGLQISVTQLTGPSVGKPLAYQIAVTNRGPAAATSVVVSNPLPSTVTFLSAVSAPGTSTFSTDCVFCNLPQLDSGSNAVVTVTVRPNFAGNLTNVAWVSAAEPDPNPADNTTNKVANVRAPYVYVVADKERGFTPEGNSGTTNAALSVKLEAYSGETISVTWTALGAINVTSADVACVADNGAVICTLPQLAPGAGAAVHFQIPTPAAGAFTCTASAASGAWENNFPSATNALWLMLIIIITIVIVIRPCLRAAPGWPVERDYDHE